MLYDIPVRHQGAPLTLVAGIFYQIRLHKRGIIKAANGRSPTFSAVPGLHSFLDRGCSFTSGTGNRLALIVDPFVMRDRLKKCRQGLFISHFTQYIGCHHPGVGILIILQDINHMWDDVWVVVDLEQFAGCLAYAGAAQFGALPGPASRSPTGAGKAKYPVLVAYGNPGNDKILTNSAEKYNMMQRSASIVPSFALARTGVYRFSTSKQPGVSSLSNRACGLDGAGDDRNRKAVFTPAWMQPVSLSITCEWCWQCAGFV
jgi:hypothetical protein